MTKRAGKRKHRMGSQRHPPGKIRLKADTVSGEDHLPEAESQRLELRAVREGWLVGESEFSKVRVALLKKVARLGVSTDDPQVAIAALRALSQAEQREVALQLRARDPLPAQVNVQTNVQTNIGGDGSSVDGSSVDGSSVDGASGAVLPVGHVEVRAVHEVVRELIARKDIRAAIDNRPVVAD